MVYGKATQPHTIQSMQNETNKLLPIRCWAMKALFQRFLNLQVHSAHLITVQVHFLHFKPVQVDASGKQNQS